MRRCRLEATVSPREQLNRSSTPPATPTVAFSGWRLSLNTCSSHHRIPPGRLHALTRFANTAKVSVIRRLPESRRLATLVAFVGNLEAAALDDALDLLDILITEMFSGAVRASDKARLRTIEDLDAAAIQLTQVCHLVLDGDVQDAELRSAIFRSWLEQLDQDQESGVLPGGCRHEQFTRYRRRQS
jgi:hypothetical protein